MPNLLNLEKVSKSYGVRPLLTDVSLGIGAGERIGIVGRNGDGKTTLLEVMTGLEEPDTGRVSQQRGLLIGYLHQGDELVDTHTVRERDTRPVSGSSRPVMTSSSVVLPSPLRPTMPIRSPAPMPSETSVSSGRTP